MPVWSSYQRARAFLPVIFLIPLLLAGLSCDATSNLVSGKPDTSAPRATNDINAFWEACDEREQSIDDWERDEERKIEDEWIDGERGLLQSGAKLERAKEDARAMRRELRSNCEAARPKWELPDFSDQEDGAFPTVTPIPTDTPIP